MKEGGFTLKKWKTNDGELAEKIHSFFIRIKSIRILRLKIAKI